MRMLTLFRGMAWFGVVVVFWSLNMRWGTKIYDGSGPPNYWHREVVGCGLLALIAALSISLSGRKRNSPSWVARGIAAVCGLLVLFIAWRMHANATMMTEDRLGGTGWTWLLAGGGLVAGAVLGTFGLPAAGKSKTSGSNAKSKTRNKSKSRSGKRR